MNVVCIIGVLTRDPELTFTASNTAVCKFGIAYNERWTKDGERQEKAHFFDVTCWGKTAEFVGKFFHKGSRVGVTGSLAYSQWEAQDGSKRSKVEIKAENVDFADSKGGGEGGDTGTTQQARRPQQQARRPSAPPPAADSGGPAIPEEDIPFAPNLA